MPRYFFEVEHNGTVTPDLVGRDLDNPDGAREIANDQVLQLLAQRDKAQHLTCVCTVRDAEGDQVFRTSLVAEAFTPAMAEAVERRNARRAEARAARLARQAAKAACQP